MIRTKLTQRSKTPALLIAAVLAWSPVHADAYRDARAALVAAYQQQDYPAMLPAARRALEARPGFPRALFNLALSETLNGEHHAALATLNTLLSMGVDFGAADAEEFAPLRGIEGWPEYLARVHRLLQPAGRAEQAAYFDDSGFVPEGIAVDDNGRIFLGSIRTGQLVRLGETARSIIAPGAGWSVFGMRFHADGSLWYAAAAVPQLLGVGGEQGQTGLFRVDPSSGDTTRAAILPQYESSQVLGDLVIADDNVLYTTDSLTGGVYRYYIDSNEFETLVERGTLVSPQGLVLDATGRFLFVADYNGGLHRIAVDDGSMIRLGVADGVTDYGIDGLYRHENALIAIQNGIRPHRVVRFELDGGGSSIIGSRVLASNLDAFDEPTLGAIRDGWFYFVANSHWNRFDRDNALPDGLSGPIVLKVPLD